jgi:hypothetical protein
LVCELVSQTCSSVFVSRCCLKLVSEVRGQFGCAEEGERPPLQAVTKQRLVKTQQTGVLVRALVKCRVCELVIALY